ncbi:MAG: hypothetical protein ACTTKH_04400 [Treponema sp.]
MDTVIKPLLQTTKGILEEVKSIGCFFRSSQCIAEMLAQKTLTICQINNMWTWAKGQGLIDENLNMKASAPIANHTLEVLGVRGMKFYEIATSRGGIAEFYKSIPPYMKKPQYFIRKIKNQFGGTHFLVVDSLGKTLFDPDPSVKEIKELYTILYTVKNV